MLLIRAYVQSERVQREWLAGLSLAGLIWLRALVPVMLGYQ